MVKRIEDMEIVGEWIPYENDNVKPCWRHNITGQITFRHPNYMGDCENCYKEINDIDDCLIKSGIDGNSKYCRKCYDIVKSYDELFITMTQDLKKKEAKEVKEQKKIDKKILKDMFKSSK